LDRAVRRILCDPNLVKARDTHLLRLESVFSGEALDRPFVLQGINGESRLDPFADPEGWLDDALAYLAENADGLDDKNVFRPLCLEFRPYGVHFVESMLGARVYHHEGEWWVEHLPKPIGDLRPPILQEDRTWHLARNMVRAFLLRKVSLPFFSIPTISGCLNVALSIYGEGFLVAMAVDPDAARHDLKMINDVLCSLCEWYSKALPPHQLQPTCASSRCQPPGRGQIYGCSTHLISPHMYRDLVAPLDQELLSVYPNGGMIHLCGDHTRHIPLWKRMDSLRAFQINDRAADDLEAYFGATRDDQVIYFTPTATTDVGRALDVSQGKRIVITPLPPSRAERAVISGQP